MAVVQAFLNTWDIEQQVDELTEPAQLGAWLAQRGLADRRPRVTDDDLAHARAMREALRGLAKANTGMPLEVEAVETLNSVEQAAELRLRFDEHGVARPSPSSDGVAAALGRLLVAVADAQANGTWRRLKACRHSDCHWVFYDTSRNAAGVWCSMSICGSRSKMRAYRRRQRRRG